jgi:CHAD domain-containing protein
MATELPAAADKQVPTGAKWHGGEQILCERNEMTPPRPDKWIQGASPDDRTADVAARSLQARLAAVLRCLALAATKAEEDVEYVHQLRVWSRRAAAALKLYVGLLPRRRTAWIKKQLKRLRRAANDARDWDVLARRLAENRTHPAAKSWAVTIRAQRAEAQKPIVAICQRLERDDRFDRRVTKLPCRVRPRSKHGHWPEDQRFGGWARASLQPLVESFFAAVPVDMTDMAALHAFRIRGKKLRYGMELLAGAFGPDLGEKLYPLVETLQDRLGAINDLATAQAHLRQRIEEVDDRVEAKHLRKLLAAEQASRKQMCRDFVNWFTPRVQQQLRAGFESLLASTVRAEPELKRA